jgi:hypothetical protein
MAKSSKLRVMLSSRCNDPFPDPGGAPLSDVRKALKAELEQEQVFGRSLLEVWINEETPPQGGTWDSWDVCIQAAKDCDALISISNGNAGWAETGGDIGICHAELMTAFGQAPGKVRLIALPNVSCGKDAAGKRNQRFQDYINKQSLFRGGEVKTVGNLKSRVKEAIADTLVSLAQAGVREASKGKFHSGDALDWSRLDFARRASEMKSVIANSLKEHGSQGGSGDGVFIDLDGKEVLTVPHAIPAAFSVGPARELVGQPFLLDHERADELKGSKRCGPFHIIACHKTATENQAIRMLGFPDATVVAAPFGIFVADNIQKVQFAFIVNCRDETTTRHAVQRFLEWLKQTGEDSLLVKRAQQRTRIIQAIAKEADDSTSGAKP